MALSSSPIVSYGGAATSTFYPILSYQAQNVATTSMFKTSSQSCSIHAKRIQDQLKEEENNGVESTRLSRREGALFCRSGTWLEVLDESNLSNDIATPYSHIRGTHHENSRFSVLEFISVAMGLVSIRGVEANRFVCMDNDGRLYATPPSNYSSECIFIEEMMENYYNLYSSCVYGTRRKPWYMELRRSGRPRRGPNSRKRRKASHFLVVHYDAPLLKTGRNRHQLGDPIDVSRLVVASLLHQPPSHPFYRPRTTAHTNIHRISKLTAKVEKQPEDHGKEPDEAYEKKKRKEKKKRRREERLMREEQARRDRQRELDALRALELRQTRKPIYRSPPNRAYRIPPSNNNY